MLPAPQAEVCLRCHGSQAQADRQIEEGNLALGERPQLLATTLSLLFTHPLTEGVFSHRETSVVTCTSCHSPHRGAIDILPDGRGGGQRKPSPRNPTEFEYELCQSCHGSEGIQTQNLLDISRLTNPSNRSFHPVEAPARDPSPSLPPSLSGLEINCSDCHRNSLNDGPRGPHGSEIRYILGTQYSTTDGAEETAESYALCYQCHLRSDVLQSPAFPLHELHVVEQRASCATCHSAHGSVENRALIRFGEETIIGGVSPSLESGRLAFESEAPGSGLCFLSCHGVDHAPEGYGAEALIGLPFPGGEALEGFGFPSATTPEAGQPFEDGPADIRQQRPEDP